MIKKDFNTHVEKRIALIRQTLLSKHKEYAKDDNVFRNFDEAAGGLSLHSTSPEVLWSYMTKHLVSIKDIVVDNTNVSPETVSEKIGDVINYLILLEAMLNKDKTKKCELKEEYEKHAVDRLSMWTSDYNTNTDMLVSVKMTMNDTTDRTDKLKYNTQGENGY